MTDVTNKIKSILALKGFSFADYARKLNSLPQTLNNKAKKNAYRIEDLIKLGELTDTELCFCDKKTKEIIVAFNENDLKK